MSEIYDNWERLVAAVLKREDIRQLCLESSESSNTSPTSSDFYPSPCNETNMNIESSERIEQYEPGVRITLLVHRDGTKEAIRATFSTKKFELKSAKNWVLDNREKVYKKYNDGIGLARIRRLSDKECLDRRQQSNELLISQYKPGVYIFLTASRDGSTKFKQVCFSQRIFKEQEAKAWWIKNQEKVYEKYNIQDQIKQPLGSTQAFNIDQKVSKFGCFRIRFFHIF